jgi:hypothetical protein
MTSSSQKYASRNVAVSKAEEQLRQQREAVAEKSRQEAESANKQREIEQKTVEQLQQLQMLYIYYRSYRFALNDLLNLRTRDRA